MLLFLKLFLVFTLEQENMKSSARPPTEGVVGSLTWGFASAVHTLFHILFHILFHTLCVRGGGGRTTGGIAGMSGR